MRVGRDTPSHPRILQDRFLIALRPAPQRAGSFSLSNAGYGAVPENNPQNGPDRPSACDYIEVKGCETPESTVEQDAVWKGK